MESKNVDFVVDDHKRFVSKQGFDVAEQSQLLLYGVVAQFTNIQNEQHDCFQMS